MSKFKFVHPQVRCTDCEQREYVVSTSDGKRFCEACLKYWQEIGARDAKGERIVDEVNYG